MNTILILVLVAIIIAFLLIIIIERRKNAELSEAVNELETINDTVPIGMCKVDNDLNVLWGNRQIREFYGLEGKETEGLNFDQLIHPSILEIIKTRLAENTNLDVVDIEGAMRSDLSATPIFEEGMIWMKLAYVPILDEEGKLKFYVLLNENHTAEKLAEFKLKQKNMIVEHQLNEIKGLNEQLKEVNLGLSNFAGMASHDLKSPLKIIRGYTQLLKNEIETKIDDESLDKLLTISTAGKRMERLVEDLLFFLKMGKNVKIEPESVDTNSLVSEIVADLNLLRSFEDEQTKLVDVQLGELPIIRGNKQLLSQLFQNLMSNSAKFVKEGDTPKVKITCEKMVEGYFLFNVQDEGIGIEPNKIKGLFEPFYRGHRDLDYDGTGLGLAICKRVIDIHKGEIWIESEENAGTQIYFKLRSDSN